MLNRKVLFVALLAVVLLGSFVIGEAGVSRDYKHRRKAAEPAAGAVASIIPCPHCVSFTDTMTQIAGGMLGIDPTLQLASRSIRKPHRSRASVDLAGSTQLAMNAKEILEVEIPKLL